MTEPSYETTSTTTSSGRNIGSAMAFIGSIILIIVGGLAMLGIFALIWYPLYALAAFWWGLAILIIGFLALGASRWVNNVGAALWLILLAIIAGIFGAWWGSWLIGLGAIIGLVTRR
ncbi:MAG: hypothetical protein NWE93_03925 [Candidatus Bathyarchaeota archaeon]|nr:hypothetical protein [Candidatus Bathyarchaeota archaeon]